ncbi:peptide deformylase, putative [Hepatocystis sp. ex Piliocolobus tephrosceles]|nr:peptide deformylase, putative [Hepatocystis sp. ex Piliocolobus tephrosceles]
MEVLNFSLIIIIVIVYLQTFSGFIINKKIDFYLKNSNLKYISEKKRKIKQFSLLLKQNGNDMSVLLYPNPLLRSECQDVITFDNNLKEVVRNMFNLMYDKKAIGLAASQININKKIIVWNALYEKKKEENERVFINPTIVEQSLIKKKVLEKCLSFPDIEAKVERPLVVSVRYYDLNGNKHLKILKGIHARIFQHEFDHLNAVLFIDKLTQNEKRKVKSKINDLIMEYKSKHSEESDT